MSSGCTTINESNYAAYDASYNPTKNMCVNTDGSLRMQPGSNIAVKLGCSNEEYACYANYTLNKKRQELDPKMAELYANAGTIRGVNNVHYDSTMLSGVIWAMLGTTVLYYAFTKM